MGCGPSFVVVCIIAILGGIAVLGLQIVSASAKSWVQVKMDKTTFSFGLFYTEDSSGLKTVTMVRYTPLVVMQAMLVLSVGIVAGGIVTTVFGITQRPICGRGTTFFIILAQIFFALSAILYLIGLSTFTHFWLKDSSKFFKFVPKNSAFSYGYAYTISWIVVMVQLGLAAFLIISVNVVIRSQDRQLARHEERDEERKKLVEEPSSSAVEKAVIEDVHAADESKNAAPEVAGTSN